MNANCERADMSISSKKKTSESSSSRGAEKDTDHPSSKQGGSKEGHLTKVQAASNEGGNPQVQARSSKREQYLRGSCSGSKTTASSFEAPLTHRQSNRMLKCDYCKRKQKPVMASARSRTWLLLALPLHGSHTPTSSVASAPHTSATCTARGCRGEF